MSDYDLYSYWKSIDIELVNAHHFAHVNNELIKRDLIQGEIIPLNHDIESEMWGYCDEYEI
jgi:hypothetical protein